YPQLVTKYYKDGDSPTNLKPAPTSFGTWNAVAVLDNATTCNYKVDATASFNATKRPVAYPTINGSATGEYDGTSQEFTFTGFDGNLMNYTVPNGVDSFNGTILKATNAGTYTPVFTLKDTTLYDWTGTAPGAVEITAKPVLIRSDDGNATEWQRRTPTTLTFDVPTTLCGSDSTLKFEAAYTLNGGDVQTVNSNSIAVNGKTCTVTIGAGFAKGNYALTVKIADGENYSGSVTHNFEITAQGLSLGNNDIKWNIAGKTFVTDDYDNGNAVYEMEYTGTPLSLSNVSVNFNSASDALNLEQDGPLTGTFINAVDVGEYSATFAIKAKSGGEYTCEDGPFTITIKIVPKKLDFSKAEWEYSLDGTNWTKFTATSKPSYTGNAVSIRISPDYMKSLGLDFDNGDYTDSYTPLNDPTEQGSKTTNVELTIINGNYTTADETGYEMIPYNWEITARALTYSWTTQPVNVGDNAFEFPAVAFADGNDYSQYYDYIYTVDGVEYTLDGIKTYIAGNWSETSSVSGTVTVRMKDGVTEVNIPTGSRPFSTGTPKTALAVDVTGSGAEYGLVDFALSVVRGTADERARTTVAITGGALTEAKTFEGTDTELVAFVNGLGVGNYVITVSLKTGNEDSYVLTKSVFDFEVLVRKVIVPQVTGDITFNGAYINVVDYLDDNYNADIMSIESGKENKAAGSYTVKFKLVNNNYMWVEPASAEPMNKLLAKALFANEISINNSELTATLGWTINKIVLATDGWNLKDKTGASLNALAAYKEMIEANELDVTIVYRYYDTNGNLIEEPVLKGGDKYIVEACLTGEDAVNFEFADGTDEAKSISAKQDYTVPQSKFAAAMGTALTFAKANWLWLVIGAAALLFLIILICIIASAKKKKRKREELAEQRRLEKEEREEQRRREDREERMARMSQQQMMMPQMMPQMMGQQMPQAGGQPMAAGGGASSNEIAELKAEIIALKAAQESAKEIAALKDELNAKEIAALRNDVTYVKRDGGTESAGNVNLPVESLTEIITAAIRSALSGEAKPVSQTAAEKKEEPAKEAAMPVCPPDAVMTTVTTTKIDTTKKPQNADRAAAPAVRTVVRNLVAPMPVDDGRVFDVGGFYTPADPVTDMGLA
ncbi:MAG: hypothetical protein K2O62_01180, partial [Clostridia bacterium]|nr:hypothetical protein [Clostridia bacterium]